MSVRVFPGLEVSGTLPGPPGPPGSGVTSNFVYQPGGPLQHDNVFTNWSDLMTAVNAVAGIRSILIDGSFASPTVPAGTWAIDNVVLYGTAPGFTLSLDDGAQLTGPTFYFTNIVLLSNSSTPVITCSASAVNTVLSFFSIIASTTAAPFFLVETDGILDISAYSSTFGDGTNPVIQADGAAGVQLELADVGCILSANATTGSGSIGLLFTPGSLGDTEDLADANVGFPQLAGLSPSNVSLTIAYPQNLQWLANQVLRAGVGVDGVTVVAVHAVQTANANTGIPSESFLGDATVPMPDHTSGKVTLEVVAKIVVPIGDLDDTVAWHAEAAFKRTGGVISVGTLRNVGGNALSFFGPSAGDEAAFAGATIGIDITANGIQPQVTGVGGLVINWLVKTTYFYTFSG